jgi:hypothetical protein
VDFIWHWLICEQQAHTYLVRCSAFAGLQVLQAPL